MPALAMTPDWEKIFLPDLPLLELVIRGTVMYLVLFAAFRILGRRHVGSLSIMDLLLMVLIGDAAQNAMADEHRSVPAGLVLCGTLIGWNYLLDWLAFRFPYFKILLESPPLPIVRNGEFIRKNLKAELMSPAEAMAQLREQGIFKIAEVQLAYIEADGSLSIKRFEGTEAPDSTQKKKPAIC